jgi:hypothetical protein
MMAVVLAACGGTPATSTTAGPPATSTSTVTQSSSTLPPPGCPQDTEFTSTGRIARITQSSSDSRTLGLISVQESDGCERLGFDFETVENAPATTPPTTIAEFLPGEGIVRIHLDIDQTVITDQLVESSLVSRLYVVRALDGGIFVDLHLAAPASAQLTLSNSPASLTLELTPRLDGQLAAAPLVSERAVLTTPLSGMPVDAGPVDISGYARTFEASVLVVASRGNDVLSRLSTTAADWVDTWGEFEAEIELEPGDVDLFVGEESPQDGSLEGVTLKLEVR